MDNHIYQLQHFLVHTDNHTYMQLHPDYTDNRIYRLLHLRYRGNHTSVRLLIQGYTDSHTLTQ